MVNQLAIPASLVFYLDSKLLTKRLQDIQTADLLTIYKEEDDEDIRQAMVPELTKRLQDVIKKGEFKVI